MQTFESLLLQNYFIPYNDICYISDLGRLRGFSTLKRMKMVEETPPCEKSIK